MDRSAPAPQQSHNYHPAVMRSIGPRERWRWCCVNELEYNLSDGGGRFVRACPLRRLTI